MGEDGALARKRTEGGAVGAAAMTRFELPEPAPAPAFVQSPAYPWLVVGTVSIGAFVGQVDASIVQLALPALETAFGAGLGAVSWVALAYMLAFACALPVFARLAEIAGRKTLYLAGFALFALFSALCGFAPSLGALIVFRLLQGVAGALLGANSVVILVAAVGPERRGKALGIMAAAQAVGLGLGPALGGILLGTLGWRWIFWVTVPFAVLAVILGWLIVPKTKTLAADRRFDLPGALLLIPALAALLLAISEGRAWGLSPPLLACLVGGPLMLAAFAWRETRTPAPLIDLRLFRSPAFSAGGVGVLVSYAMLYGLFFAMAFALVRGYHDAPLVAGLRLTIVPAALGLVAPFAGAASAKRPRLVMVAGMALCGLSALALMQMLTGAPETLGAVMISLAAYGAGLGFYIAPNNSATLGAAPAEKSGVAGGLLNLLRVFGSGAGVAAASALLGWRLEEAIGPRGVTSDAPEAALLAAVGAVLVLLAALAAIGAAAALVRDPVAAKRD
jgi:EmrB/QacA subfamily drug resistance transporter